MRPTDRRRLVILTEGQFGDPRREDRVWASSATGATTSSRSSTRRMAGRNVREYLPGHDIPIVATLDRGARRCRDRPDGLLIGIAPTGGKLPRGVAGRRSSRRSTPGSTSSRGCTRSSATTPSSRRPPRRAGTRDHRLPAAARPDGDGRRAPARAGQAGDPDRRHRLRDRQDVGRARARGARPGAPAQSAVFVPTGQTGMMIEGWGVAVDRLISDFTQGTVEWLVEQGEALRRLGHRRGPGVARPPRLLVGDAGAHPRRDAARDGHGPQAGPRRARLRPPARGVVPDRRAAPGSSSSTSGSPGWSRRRRSSPSRSTPRSIPR